LREASREPATGSTDQAGNERRSIQGKEPGRKQERSSRGRHHNAHPPSNNQGPPATTQPAPNGTKRARLTSNEGQPGKGKRTEDSRTGTAKHSRATTARNSPGDTSHQQARLKRSCQRPSKELQPMAGRLFRPRRKRSSAIGPEYSARGSSRLHSRPALAWPVIASSQANQRNQSTERKQRRK
jgi:hypothetical protein